MINKWILNNFKSINKETELEFRPLTIFTGANSSGKSTVLQSILLVTQTLQNPIASRSVVLNGRIKKFGSYSDVVNKRQWRKDMTVGFELGYERYVNSRFFNLWKEDMKGVSCQFSIGAKDEDDLQPFLKKLSLSSYANSDENIATTTLNRIENPSEKIKKVVETMKNKPDSEELCYNVNVKMSKGFSHVHFNGKPYNDLIGCSLNHFLPDYFLNSYNIFDYIVEAFFDRYYYASSRHLFALQDDEINAELSEKLRDVCEDIAQKLMEVVSSKRESKNKKEFVAAYEDYMSHKEFGKFFKLFHSKMPIPEKGNLVKRLKDALGGLPPKYEVERIPRVDYLRDYFSEHIWYLGPLREEPKALYPLGSDGSMKNVGFKGENTAMVLDGNKNKEIEFIMPCQQAESGEWTFLRTFGNLQGAVKQWLIYLGVANDVVTDDRGKIGHIMQIKNDDGMMQQDLTHVGVGVSQVLPILVMCLLAEEGDVIILEQPELHLHPKVQTRLADFFVAMNKLGKQCIVETHSEYMINRLRYRVAKSDDSSIADNTMMYFVEKEKKTGASNYRPVTINKYGVIEDWPDGFFDESEKMAIEILRAGTAKKAQENGDYEE